MASQSRTRRSFAVQGDIPSARSLIAGGFQHTEPPRLLIDPKRGRPPSDCDWYRGYWIVSDKLKAVLNAVDPDACAFVKCDVRHAQGKATDGGYWLMDIVRNLDAVDESASRRLNIRYDARLARGKSYG